MQNFTDLQSLMDELRTLQEKKIDFIVPAKKIEVDVQNIDFQDTNGNETRKHLLNLFMSIPKADVEMAFNLNEWSLSQLCTKLGIPTRYGQTLNSMNIADNEDDSGVALLSDNIAFHLQRKNKSNFMMRTIGGTVRGVMSDRYRVIDYIPMVQVAMKKLYDLNANFHKIVLTDTKLYLKALIPSMTFYPTPDDPIVPGVMIFNSEVGNSSFGVSAFCLRKICSNGMIGQSQLKQIHLGKRFELGHLSATTINLQNQALFSEMSDLISSVTTTETFENWMKAIKKATSIEIEDPTDACDRIVQGFGMSEEEEKALLYHFGAENNTQYGLVNAITRLAQDVEHDRQIELETKAGKLLLAPIAR